ncbi:MAG: M48 family metalloprotease [Pseudomonadota bacterium]
MKSSRGGRLLRLTLALMLSWNLLQPAPAGALTIEDERQVGRDALESIKRGSVLLEDDSCRDYLDNLGRRLVGALGPQVFDYKFYIIKNDLINAFAAPGGYIFIYSGLITTVKSEGELAGILCHEVAHVTSRHIANRLSQGKVAALASLGGLIAGAFIGGPIGAAMALGSMAGGASAQLHYSREDEREADQKGLDYLVTAGYDPKFMGDGFWSLLRSDWPSQDDFPTYLSTHPGLGERIGSVETAILAHPGYGRIKGRGDEVSFQAFQNRVLALTGSATRVFNHFQAMVKSNPESAAGHYGLAMYHQRRQNLDQAVKEFGLALKYQPANVSFMTDFGDLLIQLKDFDGAMKILSKAVVLRPNSTRILFLLGRTYEETGVPDRSRKLYERAVIQDPQNTEALYHLGVICGRQGDLARSHLYMGLYFKERGETRNALYHLRRAQEKADAVPPEVQERIGQALRDLEAPFGGGGPPSM